MGEGDQRSIVSGSEEGVLGELMDSASGNNIDEMVGEK